MKTNVPGEINIVFTREEIIEIYQVLYGDYEIALEVYNINHSNKERGL